MPNGTRKNEPHIGQRDASAQGRPEAESRPPGVHSRARGQTLARVHTGPPSCLCLHLHQTRRRRLGQAQGPCGAASRGGSPISSPAPSPGTHGHSPRGFLGQHPRPRGSVAHVSCGWSPLPQSACQLLGGRFCAGRWPVSTHHVRQKSPSPHSSRAAPCQSPPPTPSLGRPPICPLSLELCTSQSGRSLGSHSLLRLASPGQQDASESRLRC